MTGFSWRAVRQEATANFLASPFASLSIALTVGACFFAALVATALEVDSLAHEERERLVAGSTVYEISTTGTGLAAARCDALRSVDSVRSAGAVVATSFVPTGLSSPSYLQVITGTVGLAPIYWPDEVDFGSGDVVVGRAVVGSLGLQDGSSVRIPDLARVGRATNTASRGTQFDDVVLRVVPADRSVLTCLIDMRQGAESPAGFASSWFGTEVAVRPMLEPSALGLSPQERLERRVSIWYPAATMLVVSAVVAFYWVGRRQDFAFYRLIGVTRTRLLYMLVWESVSLVFVPAASGAAIALIVAHGALEYEPAIRAVGIALGALSSALLALPILGFMLVGLRSPVELVKGG